MLLPHSVVCIWLVCLLYYSNWIATAKISLIIFDDKTNTKVSLYFFSIFPQEGFWLSLLVFSLYVLKIKSKSILVRIMTFSILFYTVRKIGWNPSWTSFLILIHLLMFFLRIAPWIFGISTSSELISTQWC